MIISRTWLQKYFQNPLPSTAELSDKLMFHAFEIDEYTDEILDIKVLPDRASYALSHRGIAREVSAIFSLPLAYDSYQAQEFPVGATGANTVSVSVDDEQACPRYRATLMQGVKVGESPLWLKEALERVGQRSINNVVDATNYIMLDTGQPLHAFDAHKLSADTGGYRLKVRSAHPGERITTLSGEEYSLDESVLLITDGVQDSPLAIAGVKGGKNAEVSAHTTDIILESANFNGPLVRKTAQKLKLFTDASLRYQNKLSPALVDIGMSNVVALLTDIAGGSAVSLSAVGELQEQRKSITVSARAISDRLGMAVSDEDVTRVFDALGFSYTRADNSFSITPPFERNDLNIPEDFAEEVGRIIGYDRINPQMLPDSEHGGVNARFNAIESIKDILVQNGFTEIYSPSFDAVGSIQLANPLQSDRSFLRSTLTGNMKNALERAVHYAPRFLGPTKEVKLFEIGQVFTPGGEQTVLTVGGRSLSSKTTSVCSAIKESLSEILSEQDWRDYGECSEIVLSDSLELSSSLSPTPKLDKFIPYSPYPFALRDVAVWTPKGTQEKQVASVIVGAGGSRVVRLDCFDTFTKDERTSFAFRVVLESGEKTLTDVEIDETMQKIYTALTAESGFMVR